ncbi:MAG: hypothetical protein ACT4PZ_19420 [Panacagrimonas sp.]
MTKAFWKSRTLIFNAAAAVAAALPQLELSLPVLQPLIGPDYYSVLSTVVLIGNIILRAITTSAIGLKDRRFPR